MTVKHLAGVMFISPDPERLADYYKENFGIPFEKRQHGQVREHLECDFEGIHFAILKKAQAAAPSSSIVPSFALADLDGFLEELLKKEIKPLHPVIDIGQGKRISSIADPDGNTIRLIQVH